MDTISDLTNRQKTVTISNIEGSDPFVTSIVILDKSKPKRSTIKTLSTDSFQWVNSKLEIKLERGDEEFSSA